MPSDRALPTWSRQVWLVLKKDFQVERSSGEIVVTSGFFALLVVVLASMSFRGGPLAGKVVMSGAVWLATLFAAVLSLGRSWARERQGHALAGLLTSPLEASALFAGKAVSLALFLFMMELLVFPVAALFFSVELLQVAPRLVLIALFATPGIAAAGTMFGAMTVRTKARDLVLSVVLLPLLSPVLLTAVSATRGLVMDPQDFAMAGHLRLLGIFDVTFLAGGLSLFGLLIED